MIELLKKYKEIILYILFGGLTTVVNFVAYYGFDLLLGKKLYLVSNIIAWIVAVAFAFVTNKIFVFESKLWRSNALFKELIGFVGARLFSLGIEEAGMVFFIEVLKFKHIGFCALGINIDGDLAAKAILAVVVVILNYFFSKFIIFKKEKKQ